MEDVVDARGVKEWEEITDAVVDGVSTRGGAGSAAATGIGRGTEMMENRRSRASSGSMGKISESVSSKEIRKGGNLDSRSAC